jgi:hypothetical protein
LADFSNTITSRLITNASMLLVFKKNPPVHCIGGLKKIDKIKELQIIEFTKGMINPV